MADTPVEFTFVAGLTLTVDLVPLGASSAAASGLEATESPAGSGIYQIVVSDPLTGPHRGVVRRAGNVVGHLYAVLEDVEETLQEVSRAEATAFTGDAQETLNTIPRKGGPATRWNNGDGLTQDVTLEDVPDE